MHEHKKACFREIKKRSCNKIEHQHVFGCKDLHGKKKPGCPGYQHKHSPESGPCYSFDSYACDYLNH